MLCRNMVELRELICQSRLDYHGSDCSDVDSDELSDTRASGDFDAKFASLRLPSSSSCHTATPDSGLAGSLPRCGSTSDSDTTETAAARSKINCVASSQLKRPALPGVGRSNPALAGATKSKTARCTTEEFATIFDRISRKVVARWLEDANAVIAQLSYWCHFDDNFIAFGHFWLSEFPGIERGSLIRMEHDIFVERLASAFPPRSDIRLFHVASLADAVLPEFPRRLLSIEGPRLILHWLDVLTSPKRSERFRETFSSVHCSTTCHQHSEIVLSLRAFALVSLVSALVDFYQKLLDIQVHWQPEESPGSAREEKQRMADEAEVSEQRICASIRKGSAGVVHFLVKSGRVSADFVDTQRRSLVFLAVLHRKPQVLNLLLTHVACRDAVDVNRVADNGNAPLHVAASFGDEKLVEMLLAHPRIDVNVMNVGTDGATPLHLAVMHGHKGVVSRLLDAGADHLLTANGQTALGIAQSFELADIADLLTARQSADLT